MLSIVTRSQPGGRVVSMRSAAITDAFPVLSDEDRDALDRIVAELSLSYEEHEEAYENGRPYERYFDLRFGEPGWFDVTREESG